MDIPVPLNKLPAARSAYQQALVAASGHGLCFVSYGAIIQTIHGPKEVMINNYPAGWDDYYMNSGYKNCDPVIEHALSSCCHSVWTPQMFGKTILSKKMLLDVIDSGVLCGITIPMRDHRGNTASINFSGRSREPPSFWGDMRIGHLYYIAANLHDRIVTGFLSGERSSNLVHITPRERDVLSFIAEGKTAGEISIKIGIAESTVEFHTKNIREKLSASNTTQALFKAAQLNLIDFSLA